MKWSMYKNGGPKPIDNNHPIKGPHPTDITPEDHAVQPVCDTCGREGPNVDRCPHSTP